MKLCFAQNFEIGSNNGLLLYRENEKIFFSNEKINYGNEKNFSSKLNFLKINSDMSWFSTEIIKIDYSAKFDFNIVHPEIITGLLKQSGIEILLDNTVENKKITNGGAKGFCIGSKLGIDLKNVKITPSVLFARYIFEDGDFNFFYGKPDIPKFLHLNLSAEYEKRHKINFSYENFILNILNNDEMRLFYSDNYVFGAYYKYSFLSSQKLRNFYGFLGINYADFLVNGSLTPANQRYFLFPYSFFNVNGNANIFDIWMAISFNLQQKYLNHQFKIGGFNIFDGEINANIHYKYRKFFGDEETSKNIETIDLKNAGFLFFLYSFESPDFNIKNKLYIYLELQKIFICPVGISKFFTDDESGAYDFYAKDYVKTILFSGLSGCLRIKF
ncbi:MAG: hypothetical protein LBH98_07210 [Chitinispirillales bacterium]|jgi:hypothetical protein|nr:hypothetical protein [Chitinispirillales bacterium]